MEDNHLGYSVLFDGNSNGYLVLRNKQNLKNVLPVIIYELTYDEFEQYCKEKYGGVRYYNEELRKYVKLVKDFDKLCDKLREYTNKLSLK